MEQVLKKYIRPIVFINILALIIIFMYPYYLEKSFISIEYIKDFYKENRHPQVDTLFLGDSTVAYGIRPILIKNSMSLALPGSTNINVLFELKRYLELNHIPKCIAYSTSYIRSHYYDYFLGTHMSGNTYSWDEASKIYDDSKKANVLPAKEMGPLHYFTKIFYLKYIQVTINTQIKIKRFLFPFLKEIKTYTEYLDATIRSKGNIRSRGTNQRGVVNERHNYLFQPFQIIDFDDYYFDQILKLAAEKKIKFIFVEMPLLDLKMPKMDEYNLAHMKHILSQLNQYKNTKLLSIKMPSDQTKFNDINHLNTVGSTEFTNLIKPAIEKECSN